MEPKAPTFQEQIAEITGLKLWKVQLTLAVKPRNLLRVTDDEMAVILHAAADLGYENKGRAAHLKGKKFVEVCIHEVAKRAGVTHQTVRSAFLKNDRFAKISKVTREHVLKIAKEMGYQPSIQSRIKDFERGKTKF